MTRIHVSQTNFTAGEISPLLHGRTDLAKYANAARALRNVIVQPHGGATRRPGTRFVAEAGDAGSPVRLAPFQFSTEQAYLLEFGERYLRLYRDGGRIEAEAVSASVVNGEFEDDVSGWSDLSSGTAGLSHVRLGEVEEGTFGAANATYYIVGDGNANSRHFGLRFRNSTAGTVTGAEIELLDIIQPFDATAALYADSVGSPGAKVGGDSDALPLDSAGGAVFTWSTDAPALADDTDYWIVVSDVAGGSGRVGVRAANAQGPSFASGRADTVAGTGDATGGFAAGHEWRIRVTVRPGEAEGVLSLDGAAGSVAIAEQEIALTEPGTKHLLAFRVRGEPGDEVRLRVGTASGGRDLVDDRGCGPGWHIVGFVSEAAHAHVQFRNPRGKSIYVDDVRIVEAGAVELATPWPADEVFALKLAQSADVLYLAHSDRPPHKLLRHGHDEWSLVAVDFRDGPYLEENTGSTTLQPGAASGLGVALTASGTDGINGNRGFLSGDVGRPVRLKHGANWGWATIVAHQGPLQVTVDIREAFGGSGATAAWRLGAWSDTTGYPTCVTFHEQRLCWAGERSRPQTFRASKSNDFEAMAPTGADGTVEDDAALSYAIGANQVNAIRWMSSTRSLVLGTTGGTWPVRANSLDDPLTPTNVQIKRANTFGGADQAPVEVGDAVLYASPSARKLRELVFLVERDNFAAPDLTILAEHITLGGIVQTAYAQEPSGVVWAVRRDGALIAMTYEREHEVVAWTHHVLGGGFAGGAARVESVAAIPAPDSGYTQLWLAVRRTVAGTTRRFVEVLAAPFEAGTGVSDAYFVDAGLSLDAPVAIIGAMQADPVVVSAPGHGLADGDLVDIEGVVGMEEIDGRFTVADVTGDTFALAGVDGTGFAAWTSGGVARKAVGTVVGLDHLEGETLAILADGTVRAPQAVAGGALTLDPPASRVHAGYGYVSEIETLALDARLADGGSEGRTRRIDRLVLRLHRTLGGLAGPQAGRMDAIETGYGTVMDRSPEPFSGQVELAFPGGFDTEARILLRQDLPLPFTVLAVTASADIAAR